MSKSDERPDSAASDADEPEADGLGFTMRAGIDSTLTDELVAMRPGEPERADGPKPDADAIEPARVLARVKQALLGLPGEPVRIGRFVVLGRIGQGGMGVVYSAYDPELDRRVALKLLRAIRDDGAGRDRLKREAQALAKLSHVNVVPVHDVAVIDNRVVIVMEFVKGQTLRQWLTETEPSWRDTLRVYLDAARGLAAAHRAGIVHRDFKPDNVLLGDDGRVRVVDFGLARASRRANTEDDVSEERPSVPELAKHSSLGSDLTVAGTVLGTPAYMSPEQSDGRVTDERTDQYSFCVSLYEGLYGVRPEAFTDESGAHFVDLDLSPADDRDVPGWLQPLLARGLAGDPEERWPSIDALIAALSDDPAERWRRRRKIAVWSAMLAALVIGLGWMAWRAGQRADTERARKREAQVQRDVARVNLRDELQRSRDAARMLAAGSFRRDPTRALAILREVEQPANTPGWREQAAIGLRNQVAERVLDGFGHAIGAVAFSPDGARVATAATDGSVRLWPTAGSGEPELLSGHTGRVTAVVFSPDGRRLATASRDGTARVFHTDGTGRAAVLSGHAGALWSVAFSPDGAYVATVGDDHDGRIWPLDGSEPVLLTGHTDTIHSVAFSPDGALLATASADANARFWARDGRPVQVLRGHTERVWRVAFSPDGTRVLTVSRDQSARIFPVGPESAGAPAISLVGHTGSVNAGTFSPNGRRVATGSSDKTVRIWNLDDVAGEVVAAPLVLAGHSGYVQVLAFSADGTQIVSGATDSTARVWRADGSGEATVLMGHSEFVTAVAFAPDAPLIATGSLDASARLWRVPAHSNSSPLIGHTEAVLAAVFNADGTHIATASFDGSARVWSVDGRADPIVLKDHRDHVRDVNFSPDGTRIVTASTDRTARIYDLQSGESAAVLSRYSIVLSGHRGSVISAVFGPDGDRVLTTSADKTVRVWNADGSGADTIVATHDNIVRFGSFSPDGRWVLSSTEGEVRITDVEGRGRPTVLSGTPRGGHTAVFSPDGKRVALAVENTVELWNADGSGSVSVLSGHRDSVTGIAFSADGSRLATGSKDQTAAIWSVEGGPPRALLEHPEAVSDVSFSRDGMLLLTASTDRAARVWSAVADMAPVVLVGHSDSIAAAEFSPDGTLAVTASTDGAVRLWRHLAPIPSLEEALWRATTYCPTEQTRRELLGASSQVAGADLAHCRGRVERALRAPD